MDKLIDIAVPTIFLGVLGALGWGLWTDMNSPTIKLKKDEWECSKTESGSYLQPMIAGKSVILMPVPT